MFPWQAGTHCGRCRWSGRGCGRSGTGWCPCGGASPRCPQSDASCWRRCAWACGRTPCRCPRCASVGGCARDRHAVRARLHTAPRPGQLQGHGCNCDFSLHRHAASALGCRQAAAEAQLNTDAAFWTKHTFVITLTQLKYFSLFHWWNIWNSKRQYYQDICMFKLLPFGWVFPWRRQNKTARESFPSINRKRRKRKEEIKSESWNRNVANYSTELVLRERALKSN